jgi:hypothetical protein
VEGQTPATVQSLAVRFDQKGHERPFQKAIIVDIVDGYMNPGDQIVVRLGDRRFGAKGTRTQTFVEEDFRMRWYIDPVGTSRFAAIKPDLVFQILSGGVHHLKAHTPRLVGPGTKFPVYVHAEDEWGNATLNQEDFSWTLSVVKDTDEAKQLVFEEQSDAPSQGWTFAVFKDKCLKGEGDYTVFLSLKSSRAGLEFCTRESISVSPSSPVPRILFGDLHVRTFCSLRFPR